jgi:hypothetical protein
LNKNQRFEVNKLGTTLTRPLLMTFKLIDTNKQTKKTKIQTNHSSLFSFKRISSNVFKTSERENLLNFEKTTNKQRQMLKVKSDKESV